MISVGGVDLADEGRIERESLWQLLESAALVAHWDD
jgi:hypothetical protein